MLAAFNNIAVAYRVSLLTHVSACSVSAPAHSRPLWSADTRHWQTWSVPASAGRLTRGLVSSSDHHPGVSVARLVAQVFVNTCATRLCYGYGPLSIMFGNACIHRSRPPRVGCVICTRQKAKLCVACQPHTRPPRGCSLSNHCIFLI